MRTNVVLDDELVREAMALSQLKTKRDLVDQALREFVAFRKRLNIQDLRGSGLIDESYDYKALRTND